MTRKDAKEYIIGLLGVGGSDGFNLNQREALQMAISALEQPEPQWIPCSERMPHGSCFDLVNVSIHDDSGDTPFDYTSCGWVTTNGEYWIVDNEINNHVVAWMPLPAPYREEGEQ